jgi:pyruvate dehydrogenase E1 component
MLHPGRPGQLPYVVKTLQDTSGPIVAASDNVCAVPLTVAPWLSPDYRVLGTDGFGRSEARPDLRRFFEVDAEHIALAALSELSKKGQYDCHKLPEAIKTLGVNPDKPIPWTV